MTMGQWIMGAIGMVALICVLKVVIKDLVDLWKNR